ALPFIPLRLGAHAGEIVAAIPQQRFWVIAIGILVAFGGAAMAFAARRGPGAMLVSAGALALIVIAVCNGLGDRFMPNRTRSFLSEVVPKIPESAQAVIYP